MATRSSSPVSRLLARYPPDVRTLASSARQLIRGLLPRVDETVDAPGGLIGYGYGPGYIEGQRISRSSKICCVRHCPGRSGSGTSNRPPVAVVSDSA